MQNYPNPHFPNKLIMKKLIGLFKGLLILLASMSFGTLYGQTNSLVLDGKGAYLDIPESVNTTSEGFTFETWFYYTGAQRWARLMDFGNDTKTNMFLTSSGSKVNMPQFAINKDGKTDFIISNQALKVDTWYHIAAVFEGSTFTMYLNGEVAATKNLTIAPASLGTLQNRWIGKSHYSWDDYLNSKLAETRIWNVARTADEIKESMSCALNGSEEGLSALYQFKVAADSIAIDTRGIHFGTLRGDNGVPALVEVAGIAGDLEDCKGEEETEVEENVANALSFDGSGDYVELGNPPFYVNSFAIETWIKPTGKATGTVFNIKDQARNSAVFLMFNGTGQLRFTIRNPAGISGGLEIVSTTAFTDNKWHHVAAVKGDDDKTYLYVDGKLEKTSTSTIADFGETKPYVAFLGMNVPGAERYYKGIMDEVRIWDRARTQEEIATDYNKTLTGTEAGLHAYYKFDQGTPGGDNSGQTSLVDATGKVNGTLNGFALTGEASNFVRSDLSLVGKPEIASNNALHLDGTKDYVDARATATGLPQGREPRTMEAWVKTTQTSIGNFISWGRRANHMRNSMAVRGGKLAYIGQYLDFTGKTPINDGEWHHVALSYDGENWAIYVDGKADGTSGADPNTTDQNLKIGNLPEPHNGEYFDGTMDELRVWNVARTADEIVATMNTELTGKEEGLVAYYNFNQGVAGGDNSTVTTLMDRAGKNNGTLTDFALTGDASNWVASNPAIQSLGEGPVVEVFQHYGFGGTKVELAVGEYNAPLELGNNSLSSVKVKPGFKVILFDQVDFKGNFVEITEDVSTIGDAKWNFNDKTSSIKVQRVSNSDD